MPRSTGERPKYKRLPAGQNSAMTAKRVVVTVDANGNRIFTALPPRRRKKSSKLQMDRMSKFQDAVYYAKRVLKDPKLKASYQRKLKGHRNVFQAALSEYMQGKVKW
ncbi:MAG: hypothetical protein JST46_16810 [Bacteroidetes bacterium]|nr:hypothetical protein [Bacteroidota bacterium]